MNFINIQAFELESLRNELAKKGELKILKNTYLNKLPEIKNFNTGKMWDKLNIESKYTYKSNPMAMDRISTAFKYLNKKEKAKILDFGFGPANFERVVNREYGHIFDIVGIDISNKSVELAKKAFPKWKFIKSTIYGVEIKKTPIYDYVVVLEVLEHISPSRIMGILNRINKLMKTGGKIIVSVPLNEGLLEMITSGYNPNAHVRVYSKELIQAELKMCGFEIKKYKYLFAYHSLYNLKTFVTNFLKINKLPNNIVLIAEKV